MISAFSDLNKKYSINSLTCKHSFLLVFRHLHYLNSICRMRFYSSNEFIINVLICSSWRWDKYLHAVFGHFQNVDDLPLSRGDGCCSALQGQASTERVGVGVGVSDIHCHLQCVNPPWPHDGGVCTQRGHSSPGNTRFRLGQTLAPPERTVDHRFIYKI